MHYRVVDHGVTPMSLKLKAAFVALALAIVVLAAEVLCTNLYGVHLTGEESGPKVQAAADQFQPGKDWKKVADQSLPAAMFCNDSSCPSVYRAWDIGSKPADSKQLQDVLKASGYTEAKNAECTPEGKQLSPFIVQSCTSTTLESNGVIKIVIRETVPKNGSGYIVALSVQK
jgi:hypothetical protein